MAHTQLSKNSGQDAGFDNRAVVGRKRRLSGPQAFCIRRVLKNRLPTAHPTCPTQAEPMTSESNNRILVKGIVWFLVDDKCKSSCRCAKPGVTLSPATVLLIIRIEEAPAIACRPAIPTSKGVRHRAGHFPPALAPSYVGFPSPRRQRQRTRKRTQARTRTTAQTQPHTRTPVHSHEATEQCSRPSDTPNNAAA